jgi:hypothetical protein
LGSDGNGEEIVLSESVDHSMSTQTNIDLIDFVIVSYGPDVRLLRHCLASYELYFQQKNKLFLFVSKSDAALLGRVKLPQGTTLVHTDDFPELRTASSGVVAQIYLKMIAHRFVTTDYYCIIDSDFVFLRPTSVTDFFLDGKPIWFYTSWAGHEKAMKWRSDSEKFLGFSAKHLYMDIPQYVFKKTVAAELESKHSLNGVLELAAPSEYIIYGAYAHSFHPELYEFRDVNDGNRSICAKVNQVPPTYSRLDPSICYEQFADKHYVVFWSHWNLAESKMIEFFEESQKNHFGKIVRKADRQVLLPPVEPGDFSPKSARCYEGVYADGWLTKNVKFIVDRPAYARRLRMRLDVPENPAKKDWCLAGTAKLGDVPSIKAFLLQPGSRDLTLNLDEVQEGKSVLVQLEFAEGFSYDAGTDAREFRARLRAVEFEDSLSDEAP